MSADIVVGLVFLGVVGRLMYDVWKEVAATSARIDRESRLSLLGTLSQEQEDKHRDEAS